MRLAIDLHPFPAALQDLDRGLINLWVSLTKCRPSSSANRSISRPNRSRVRTLIVFLIVSVGTTLAVVARGVGGLEIARQRRAHFDFANRVHRPVAQNFQDAHLRFSVSLFAQFRHCALGLNHLLRERDAKAGRGERAGSRAIYPAGSDRSSNTRPGSPRAPRRRGPSRPATNLHGEFAPDYRAGERRGKNLRSSARIRIWSDADSDQRIAERNKHAPGSTFVRGRDRALRDYNRRYREKFGFPFVICARVNKKDAILAAFPGRLENSRAEEIETALREIFKIADLRLHDLIA